MPERRARYAYLGPAGTFTETALRQVALPEESVYLPQIDVVAAIEAVRTGEADYAVVAIENSVEGGVAAVLDGLAVGEPLVVLREMLVPVTFTLAGRPGHDARGRAPRLRPPARVGAVPPLARHAPSGRGARPGDLEHRAGRAARRGAGGPGLRRRARATAGGGALRAGGGRRARLGQRERGDPVRGPRPARPPARARPVPTRPRSSSTCRPTRRARCWRCSSSSPPEA